VAKESKELKGEQLLHVMEAHYGQQDPFKPFIDAVNAQYPSINTESDNFVHLLFAFSEACPDYLGTIESCDLFKDCFTSYLVRSEPLSADAVSRSEADLRERWEKRLRPATRDKVFTALAAAFLRYALAEGSRQQGSLIVPPVEHKPPRSRGRPPGSKNHQRDDDLPPERLLFARNLERARRDAGMSQADLAEASGVAQSHISQLERGAGEPRLGTIVALAKALRTKAASLIGDE
jgi:DNA-binding XRE family transcriptional regulator